MHRSAIILFGEPIRPIQGALRPLVLPAILKASQRVRNSLRWEGERKHFLEGAINTTFTKALEARRVTAATTGSPLAPITKVTIASPKSLTMQVQEISTGPIQIHIEAMKLRRMHTGALGLHVGKAGVVIGIRAPRHRGAANQSRGSETLWRGFVDQTRGSGITCPGRRSSNSKLIWPVEGRSRNSRMRGEPSATPHQQDTITTQRGRNQSNDSGKGAGSVTVHRSRLPLIPSERNGIRTMGSYFSVIQIEGCRIAGTSLELLKSGAGRGA